MPSFSLLLLLCVCVFYNLCEEKNLSVLSLVAAFFLDNCRHEQEK